ncbi:hypothetical protein KAX22_08940 [bacterium]|nr:hypothetical protein [bacterium]
MLILGKETSPVTNEHLFFWKTAYLFGVVLLLTSAFFMFREKLAFYGEISGDVCIQNRSFSVLLSVDNRPVIQQNPTIPSNFFYKEVDATFRFQL